MKSLINLCCLFFITLTCCFNIFGQASKEILLSETENAYNPIPSPDGSMIAYVRTGMWEKGSGGLGRSNLRSQIMVMDKDGKLVTNKPIADAFLSGWTPDGKNLMCYRSWRYFLVSLDGQKSNEIHIPPDSSNLQESNAQWGTYLPGVDAMIFVHHTTAEERFGVSTIRTADKEIARKKAPYSNDGYALFGEMLVPSPDGRYIAAIDNRSCDNSLWVYDTQNKSWANLGKITIHPTINHGSDWQWMSATWNPWFADSSRLALISNSQLITTTPDGKSRQTICKVSEQVGLPTPSPDGKSIAYVTFDAKLHPTQPHWTFWGNTTIWVVPTTLAAKPHAVTKKSPETTYCLRWLNPNEIIFDRFEEGNHYSSKHRLWKVTLN